MLEGAPAMRKDAGEAWRLGVDAALALRRSGALGAVELVASTLGRLAAVNPALNAVIHLDAEAALLRAAALDADGASRALPLSGLPILVHDLLHVAGMPTRFGCPAFASAGAEAADDPVVAALRAAGAVVIGKANVPEFGAGAACENDLHGATRNAWDGARTPGGSGAVAALVAGGCAGATGGDLAGSLRVPAAFSGVVGLRPSAGRVPRRGGPLAFDDLNVIGPFARSVLDAALLLDAMVAASAEDPLALGPPAIPFAVAARHPAAPARVGFSPALGLAPVDPEVEALCRAALSRLARGGSIIHEAAPMLDAAPAVFATLRAQWFATAMAPVVAAHRAALRPAIIENLERAERLQPGDIPAAITGRAALYAAMQRFFEGHDLLASAATIVPALPIGQRQVTEVPGARFGGGAVDWLRPTTAITLTGCPALVLPCGVTAAGLPVGLQLVAPPRQEARLFTAAAFLERALGFAAGLPIDPR
jgi:amidase